MSEGKEKGFNTLLPFSYKVLIYNWTYIGTQSKDEAVPKALLPFVQSQLLYFVIATTTADFVSFF